MLWVLQSPVSYHPKNYSTKLTPPASAYLIIGMWFLIFCSKLSGNGNCSHIVCGMIAYLQFFCIHISMRITV